MSEQVIDERVVSMKFDNKEFEKNATQSLSTIQKLKQALNFKDAAKGLDEVKKASKAFDLSHIGNSVDAIKEKFNGWEVAARAAITNVTNSAVNAAKRMVESVTIDPIKTGMSVYEQKINSVQTMLNNSGKDLATVTKVLDDLNEYSDKTIFSLNDMTTALGKFTAQGVDLEKAATIIKGAANEAATMGAGSAEFSRFIYNLTQAYGMGKMTTIDWKSLENAGVAGKKFKEQLIESYETMAKLGKVTDKFVGKLNASNLREYLKDGIITAEVMTDTFEKYAGVKEGFEDFGKAALDAAQEIKTFHQLLDVLAESVASSWSQTFSYIFGNFYEAKNLWTNISKMFDQTIGAFNQRRNDLLKTWSEGFIDPAVKAKMTYKELEGAMNSGAFVDENKISGRTLLLDSFCNVLQAILQVIKPIKEAFGEFFPAATAENLWQATYNLREFTSHLKLSEGAIKEIKDAFRGFFAIINFGKTLIKDIIGALIPATKEVDSLAVIILKLAGFLGRSIVKVIESIKASEGYKNALQGITYYAGIAIKIIGFLVSKLFQLGKAAHEAGALQKAFTFLGSAIEVVVNLLARLAPAAVTVFRVVGAGIAVVLSLIGEGLSVVEGFFGKLFGGKKSGDESGGNIVAGIAKGIEDHAGDATGAMTSLADMLVGAFCKDLKIQSPSLVFAALGAFIVAGLVVGIAKNANLLSESENALLQGIGNIGKKIAEVVNNIKISLTEGSGAGDALVTHMEQTEEAVTEHSEGLLNRIGNALRKFVSGLKDLNVAAIVVIGIIGVLLYNVTRLIMTFYSIGDAARNGLAAAKNITKGFEKFASAFKRMHSPLVETLKGVAICVMGIAASIWLLSTLKDTGKLAPALASLLISFGLIMAVIVGAAKIANKNELTDDIKNLALMVFAISGAFVLMGIAFEQITSTISKEENTWQVILSSIGVIIAIAGALVASQIVLSKFKADASIKQVISIIAWSFAVTKVINAITKLIDATAPLREKEGDIGKLWTGGILPVLALMGGIAAMGMAFNKTGVGSALTVLAMLLAVKGIIAVVAKIPWEEVVDKVNAMKDTLILLGVGLTILVTAFAITGSGLKDFGQGLLYIVGAIAGMVIVCKSIEKLKLSDKAISQAIKIVGMVGLLAAALIVVMHFADVPVGKFTGFSLMLLALDTVMLTLAKTVEIVNKSGDFNQGKDTFTRVALCLTGLVGCLAVLAFAMIFTKDAPVGKFALVILALTTVVLSLSLLAKNVEKLDTGKMVAVIASLVVVFAGLFFLIAAMSHLDSGVKTGPLVALMGSLLVIFGSLILISLVPMDKLISATAAMAVLMGMLFLDIAALSHIQSVNTGPMLALVAALVVVTASLMLLANYEWEQLFVSMGVMVATMASFALMTAAMKGIDASATGPMLVAVIAVLGIAASLGFLAMMDWPGIIDSAIALSATLLAVSVAMRIISGGMGGAGNILASSVAIAIVAGSLILIAYAMNILGNVDFDYVFMAGIAIATIALALMVLSSNATGAVIASVAIIAVAGALVLIGAALNMFTLVAAGDVLSAIGMIAIITVVLYALSAVAPMAILAAGALILTAAALVILGAALMIIGQAQAGAGTLALIALALIPMAIAGLLLTPAAPGLILAAIGLRILAPALVTMGKAYKNLTGTQLAGIAGGLMAIAVAGILLIAGSKGLIEGGVGINILALGLVTMSSIKMTGKQIKEIGEGLLPIVIAGAAGVIAGPGLMALASGIMTLSLALAMLSKVTVEITELDFARLAHDSVEMGRNIVQGLIGGIGMELPNLMRSTLLMCSTVEDTFRNTMGIHSMSTVFIGIGKWILKGLGFGLSDSVLNSDLSDTMKGIADNLLSSFTGEFGGGMSKIEEILNKFNKKTKKWVETGGHYEYGRGWVKEGYWEEVEESLFGDTSSIFSKISEEFTHLFDEGGFGGAIDMNKWFDDIDFDVKDVTNSLSGLSDALGDTENSNSKLTQSMAKSIDLFAEYDDSLTKTTKEIKKNLIGNVVGEKEFLANLNNLLVAGFSTEIVQKIKDMGYKEGNSYATALLAGAADVKEKNFVQKINEEFQAGLGAAATLEAFDKILDGLKKGNLKLEDLGLEYQAIVSYFNGDLAKVNPTADMAKLLGADIKDVDKTLADMKDQWKQEKEEIEKDEKAAEKTAAKLENEEAADQAIADLKDAITNSIGKYMSPEKFVGLGKNICIGLASGIWGYMSLSTKAVEMSAKELIAAFMKETKEHSPSKVFYQLGSYIQEGLANGIDENDSPVDSTKQMADELIRQFQTAADMIAAIMETDDTWQPTIRPIVDFSNIQAGAYDAQNMFNGIKIANTALAAGADVQAVRAAAYGTPTLSGMTRDEFRSFLTDFAETIVDGINTNDRLVDVNVNLEGDAAGIFKVVRDQNTEYKKTTGRSALA